MRFLLSTILSLNRNQPPKMAIEATYIDLFRPQLIQDRLNLINQGKVGAPYNSQQMHSFGFPELPENPAFFYQSPAFDSVPAKTSVNTDSGLTYNVPAPRKRSRDCFNFPSQQKSASNMLPFMGEDVLPQIQQSQFEINDIINWHTKKIRLELEERQKQQARLLAAAIGEGVMKKLKEKEEQIQRIGKMNLALQEKVRNLYVENQLWRDLAQANEATANSLRANLVDVLLQVGGGGGAAVEEDAESCCGSSDHGRGDAQDKDEGRKCKICEEREACVLLLPCRHLCLCSGCGSGAQQVRVCPICNSSMTATLHVNMSS